MSLIRPRIQKAHATTPITINIRPRISLTIIAFGPFRISKSKTSKKRKSCSHLGVVHELCPVFRGDGTETVWHLV